MKNQRLLALLPLALLAACQTAEQPEMPRQVQQQATVEGDWVDNSGIVSTFQAGAFTTRTTDSNQVLASGTYISTGPALVEISMTSHVRSTQSKVNCQLVSAVQLNCTSQTGAQFSLARRPANAPPLAPLASKAATLQPTTSTTTTTAPAAGALPTLKPGANAKL